MLENTNEVIAMVFQMYFLRNPLDIGQAQNLGT